MFFVVPRETDREGEREGERERPRGNETEKEMKLSTTDRDVPVGTVCNT